MKTLTKQYTFTIIFLIVALLFTSSATASFAASESTLIKEYEFNAPKVAESYNYKVPETIKENNREYELIDVTYEVIKDNKVSETVKVTTNNKEIYDKQLEHKLPNQEVTYLKADESSIEWEEETLRVNRTVEYGYDETIPDTIKWTKTTDDGESVDITLKKENVQKQEKTVSFTAPAEFYAPTIDTKKYAFNGKIVVLEDSPVWDGYENDVKDYLGVNGNTYTINNGKWTGAAEFDGEQYVRTAIFTGTKLVPHYVVNYVETDDTAVSYTAEIVYEGYVGDATIKAIATYEKVGLSPSQKVAIGAGILVLAGLIVLILYIISKRRAANNDEEAVKGI